MRRYPPLLALLGALVIVISAMGEWETTTVSIGVELPIFILLGLIAGLFVLLGVLRWQQLLEPRSFATGVFAVGLLAWLVGMYGYAAVFGGNFDNQWTETAALVPAITTIVGGGIAIAGGLGDWFEIEPTSAKDRTKAAAIVTGVGFGGLILMFIWSQILLLILVVITGDFDPPLDQLLVVSNVALGLGMGTMAGIYLLLADRTRSFIDLRIPGLRDIAWTFVGIGGLFAALIIVGIILQLIGTPPAEHGLVENIRAEGDPNVVLYILIPSAILIIGPGEELLFRNIVQKSLYDYFSRPAAIILASLVFAVAHIPAYWAGAGTITAVIVISVLSLVLGAIYAKTENIIVPAVIHGLYNAILFGVLYIELTSDVEVIALLPTLVG